LSALPGVLIVDFSADQGRLDWGGGVAAVLPADTSIVTARGAAGAGWAQGAIESGRKVILSGSDVHSPRDESWFEGQCAELRAVIAAGAPVFGICFGHQLIVQALGGVAAVRRAARGEYGVTVITPLPPVAGDPVLGRSLRAGEPAEVYNLHADEIAGAAAAALGLVVLAASIDCAVEAFRLPGRPVWGVQFHPEMTGPTVAALAAGFAAEFGNAAGGPPPLAAIAAGPSHQRPDILAAFLTIERSA
jgi:GMP synthase (glutamine-hydrolysing)